MKRIMIVGILLVLSATLVACSSEAATPESLALPQSIQLSLGTLKLAETPQAVTAEQAQELLPLWQMLRTLQQSDTAAQAEIEAVLKQIQAAMAPEQLAAIKEMNLTPASMRAMAQELGLGLGSGEESSSGSQEGGFRPPDEMIPGGGPGPGGGMMGGGTDLSPEEQATAIAERMSSGFGTALMDKLIELLESRAGGVSTATKATPEATALPPVETNNSSEPGNQVVTDAEVPSVPTGSIVAETLVTETPTPTATSQPSNSPITQSSDAGAEVTATPQPTPAPTVAIESATIVAQAAPTETNELTGKLVFQTSK